MDCLCLATRRAARALTRMYEDELRPSGLTAAQFGLLSLLAGNGSMTQAQLAETANLDQTTLSRSLRLMSERRWVKHSRSKDDARLVVYVATDAGVKVRREASVCWHRAQQKMQKKLGKDWRRALALMQTLAEAA